MSEIFTFLAGFGVSAWVVIALFAKGVLAIVPREPAKLPEPVPEKTEKVIVLDPRPTSEGGQDMQVVSRKK